jgi:hypothetical protein
MNKNPLWKKKKQMSQNVEVMFFWPTKENFYGNLLKNN